MKFNARLAAAVRGSLGRRLAGAAGATLVAALAAPGTAAAATPAAAPGGLEEVTVTAQRREQTLQEVPIAVSAFTETDQQIRQINETLDLIRNIPNLAGNANVGVGTSSAYYLRGIGNAESIATFDVPVGTYVDDVYISRQNANNFALFDVERIEVLRGPQGTLFGRNTTGGAINVVMKKPGTEFGGFAEVGFGRFEMRSARASVDMPVSDRVLTKLSAYLVQDDGWATQVSTGRKFNARDSLGVRGAVRFLPTDALTVDLVADYVKDDNVNFLNVVGPGDDRVVNNRIEQGALVGLMTGRKATLPPDNHTETVSASLNVTWDLADATFQSITGYRDTSQEFLIDSAGELPRVTTARGFNPLANIGSHEQFSQEFKLNGVALDGRLNWVTGLYYLTEDNVTDFGNGSTNTITGVFAITADRTMKNGLDTYAFYAQGDYDLSERLTATMGVRWTEEKKDFTIDRNPGALGAAISTVAIQNAGIPTRVNESVVTPRFALAYQMTPDVMLFYSSTRGFKSGGWPARAVANNAFVPFKPEKVWSHEIGLRGDFLDSRLRLNATAFYALTNDIQIPARFEFNGVSISTTTNPADLKNAGVEVELTWVPVDDLQISASVGLQDAKYTDVSASVQAQAAQCRAGVTAQCDLNFVDQRGNIARPVRAPDTTASLVASYGLMLGSVKVTPSVTVNYTSDYAIGTSGSPTSTRGQWTRSTTLFNAGVNIEPTTIPGLSFSVDCRNCSDKAYAVSYLPPFVYLDRPGSWSVRARYRF
ncbi:MAG: TonB-dependent receptor [Pseudomonadota bacterium]